MSKSGREEFNSGFFREFDYQWQVQDKKRGMVTKSLLDPETKEVYKYPVPTDMGMAAMCAYYKIKKGLDIRFSPYKSDTASSLDDELSDLIFKKDAKEQNFGLIAGSMEDRQISFGMPGHLTPLLVKVVKKEGVIGESTLGDLKVAMFVMDSTGSDNYFARYVFDNGVYLSHLDMMNEIKDSERFRKKYPDEEHDKENQLLPLFMVKEATQVDQFSCRIKAMADISRALRGGVGAKSYDEMMNDEDLLQQAQYGTVNVDAPAVLHKTTQNKSLLSAALDSGADVAIRDESSDKPKTFAEFEVHNRRKFIERTTNMADEVIGGKRG